MFVLGEAWTQCEEFAASNVWRRSATGLDFMTGSRQVVFVHWQQRHLKSLEVLLLILDLRTYPLDRDYFQWSRVKTRMRTRYN